MKGLDVDWVLYSMLKRDRRNRFITIIGGGGDRTWTTAPFPHSLLSTPNPKYCHDSMLEVAFVGPWGCEKLIPCCEMNGLGPRALG